MDYVESMGDFVAGLMSGWPANELSVVHGVGGQAGQISNRLLSAFRALGVPASALASIE